MERFFRQTQTLMRCHTNRRTGDYHCHRQKLQLPGRVDYCHVISEERRCGYAKRSCLELSREFGGSCERE